jgi:DNA-binding cell septation regulator SpoVG
MKIEITDIRIVENPKSTLAFVDVRIEGIEIKDFRIMTNGKTPYVRTPFSTYKDKSGKLQFRPIVILSGEDEWRIQITILDRYRQMKEVNHGKSAVKPT